jgi:hypothetical protein
VAKSGGGWSGDAAVFHIPDIRINSIVHDQGENGVKTASHTGSSLLNDTNFVDRSGYLDSRRDSND